MKYTELLLFLLLIGCNNSPKEQIGKNKDILESEYTLTNNDFALEIIEAFVPFVGTPFKANDKLHISYELSVLNNRRIPLILKKVEVYNTKTPESPIAEFNSEYLNKRFKRHGMDRKDNPLELKGNQFGIINIWLSLNESSAIPLQVFHKLIFERIKDNGETTIHTFEAAIINIAQPTELSLSAPFNKGKWLYGINSHRDSRLITDGKASYPQRYAIDWLMIDEEGLIVKNEIINNKNWTSYGVELLAVANGTVVDIKDGIIENTPLTGEMAVPLTRETFTGNYVVIDIGNNIYAFYAHLIPNELKVKIGDQVTQSQVIGLLGNSGSSDAPHLHFHLETKSKTTLGGEGVPYYFKEFSQLKKYTDNEFDTLFEQLNVPLNMLKPSKRFNELPIGNGIVEF